MPFKFTFWKGTRSYDKGRYVILVYVLQVLVDLFVCVEITSKHKYAGKGVINYKFGDCASILTKVCVSTTMIILSAVFYNTCRNGFYECTNFLPMG